MKSILRHSSGSMVSKAEPSTVYLVGAGPGDNKLITVKGCELIKKADCIIYDHLADPGLLKFRKDNCVLIYAGKESGAHTLTQDNINRLLARKAKAHRVVVRLKGGDPFVFGRGAEEAVYLRKKKINFEIVPGVTSAIAALAYAGIPLTERAKTSAVGFITGHEDPAKSTSAVNWRALAEGLGTMVILMGVNNIDSISRKLIACGKPEETPVALIQRGTTARQKTVIGTLKNIARLSRKNKITPPAIIVVGETVNLRKELNWFEAKPLFAERIIVTRTRPQASLLSEKLAAQGAEVIEIPTIEIVSMKADRALKNAFSRDQYDWIFFTSQNGVDEFAEFLKRTGKDSRIFGRAGVCAVGPETAKALHAIGIRPDYIPQRFIAEQIVRHFRNLRRKGNARPAALILRAKKARDVLPEGLKRSGFSVRAIDLYDTIIPGESRAALKQALESGVDMVTFTSSSTVENFIRLLGDNYRRKLSGVRFASIGPATSHTIKKFGLKPDIEAKAYTIEGLVDAIVKGKII